MTRHLTPLHLAQPTISPAPPPAGHIALYPGPDDTLRHQTPAGHETRISPATRTVLPQDHLHTDTGWWRPVPGLDTPAQPGLYRLTLSADITANLGGSTNLRLDGPPAAFGSFAAFGTQEDGPWHIGLNGYHWLDDLADTIRSPHRSAAADGLVLITAPGTITVEAGLAGLNQSDDFEDGDTGYALDGADLDPASTDVAHGGDQSGKLTAHAGDRAIMYDWWPTGPGIDWTLSAWLYAPTGHPKGSAAISWYDDDGQKISDLRDERPVPAATWVQHQVTGTAPPGTAEMYVQIGMETAAGHAAGSVLYVDDVVWRATSGWMRMLAGSFLQLTPV
ncbi:hypothetical protein [Spongiactinospora sp. 9N601]|uniref:hypothetical protein n=1 Tax=Spongiactinospora sp. 9N601 TaxID=3375149 RepID=UPI003797422D